MEDEWEEEEQLVVVELAGTLSNDFLTKNKSDCKIIDIDSENPFMQVGQFVFAGEYEDALGTCVLFEEQQRKGKDSAPELKYKCHTVKKLMMQRVFLTRRKEEESSQGKDNNEQEEENKAVLMNDDGDDDDDDDDDETGMQDDTQDSAVMEESLMD